MDEAVKVLRKLVLVIFLAVSKANLTSIFNWTTCETGEAARDLATCHCTSDVFINVIARCHINHVTDLRTIISAPQDVLRLDLSGNNVKEIPSNSFSFYGQLVYLSLSANKIHTISQRAFTGLSKLLELNLQDNIIKEWDTTLIEQDLPNLVMLNVAQNIYWKPDQQVLSLPNLKIINLLSWSADVCFRIGCHLIRRHVAINNTSMILENVPPGFQEEVDSVGTSPHTCRLSKLRFHDANVWGVVNSAGYYFHCRRDLKCFVRNSSANNPEIYLQNSWFYFEWSRPARCWNMINSIFYVPLIEGVCAMVFNLIVIMTTLRSRVLRESVAHVLVANIAVGDLLISLYLTIITSTRQMMLASEYEDFYLPYYCRIVGLLFIIGQISSPFMSFIMTLERYLAVVYCMRPHIRITRRMTYVAMAIVWGLSLALAVSFMTSPKFSLTTTIECIPLENIDGLRLTYFLGGIGIFLYAISIVLYGHLYLDFQKTNQKTVQLQRENRLARRIALIMLTNVLFFILPLLVIVIVEHFILDISHFDAAVFLSTFPISFLGVNPCLNPFLFSFRNETFRQELRRHCPRCTGSGAVHPS